MPALLVGLTASALRTSRTYVPDISGYPKVYWLFPARPAPSIARENERVFHDPAVVSDYSL